MVRAAIVAAGMQLCEENEKEPKLPQKFKIGVFGSAAGDLDRLRPMARTIGKESARRGGIVITGGCGGLPQEAALGANEEGGMVIGISPAGSLEEHITIHKFPFEPGILVFTGQEKKGRNPINIRTCDAGILISGRSGTLNEFTILYDEGGPKRVMGLLDGSGGVVDHEIKTYIERTGTEKPTMVTIVRESDPCILVEKVFQTLNNLYREIIQ